MTAESETRNRWALLIGINEYPALGAQSYLKGCLNDVEAMSKALTEQFKFPKENLTILRDGEATRDGILAAMNAFAERVGKDDVAVFHYSGHGSRMRDLKGEGEDGMDETIVPYDSGRNTENRDIRDGEIHEWLLRLTEKTPYVTLIFDCCHSGSIVRDAFGEQSRSVPPDLRVPEGFSVRSFSARARSASLPSSKKGPSGWLPLGERYVVFSGCNHLESSYEVKVGDKEEVRHGALTYYLTQALAEGSGSTCLDIFEKVAPRVTSLYQFQHPQLEGARDRELFGIGMIEPMKFVPVLVRSGDQVSLGAGASCGLTAGSVCEVYPSGTKTEEGTPLGKVTLTRIGAVTSEAKIDEEVRPNEIKEGTRAVERSRFLGETRLVVGVLAPADQPDVQTLLTRIGQSKLLRHAREGENPEARIYLLPPRTGAFHGEPAPSLGALKEETWAVAGRDGQLLMLPRPRTGQDGIAAIVRNLEGRVRFRHACSLENPGSRLEGKIEVKLLRREGGAWIKPEGNEKEEPILYEGDPILFEITNRYDRPLHVYLLNLGSGGSVSQLYPELGVNKALEPGLSIRLGDRRGEELSLYFPDELSSSWHLLGALSLEGRETFKLFVTTRPADFKVLLQPGYVRTGRGGSLTESLSALMEGGFREVRQGTGEDDWTVVQRSFRLLPRPQEVFRSAAAG